MFHRPARIVPPPAGESKIVIPVPPQRLVDNSLANSWVTLLLPILTSVGMAAYLVTMGRPILIVVAVVFVLVSVATTVGFRWQMNRTRERTAARQRRRYRHHLALVRREANTVAAHQRLLSEWAHPAPELLLGMATSRRRLWERRQTDQDFLLVRLGLGNATLATPLQLGRLEPMADYDRDSLRAARDLVARFGRVSSQPVWIDLGRAGVVSLLGPRRRALGLARALLCQATVLHAPEDLLVAVHAGTDWEWAKWLPHTSEPDVDTVVPLVAPDPDGLADVLTAELERRREAAAGRRANFTLDRRATPVQRRLLVVLDRFDPVSAFGRSALLRDLLAAAGPELGLTLVIIAEREADEPGRVDLRIRVGDDRRLSVEGAVTIGGDADEPVADAAGPALAALIARAMTPLTLGAEREQLLSRTVSLPELLLGAEHDADLTAAWSAAPGEATMRVPIGTDGGGETVLLDLKESALGGMGPHGLIVGATGSGKSELLRTLVTGLAVTHGPDLLNLVLIDFKGGATFAPLTELPHVAGLITNLADDLALIDRVQLALQGEQQRRQRLLRDAGNIDSVHHYQMRRAAGEPLEPLPYLLIIVDEFGELLSRRPEFVDLFVQIGRVGRSLGMHLLLATQRLEEGRLRGLESHLSYRLCLRTFSAEESRAAIGTPDAYRLPALPGSCYLKVDESLFQRFRVAHVSGPHRADASAPAGEAEEIVPFAFRRAPEAVAEAPRVLPGPAGPSEMEMVVRRLSRLGPAAHQVWLPPLPAAVPLDAVLGPVTPQPGRGPVAAMWPRAGRLSFPLGILDLPAKQAQQTLVMDFAGPHGHLAVVGAPRTGRSTLLRTLMLSGMLTHRPDEAQFYAIDYGGGSLLPYAAAPHVGAVASRGDTDLVRRILVQTQALVAERERSFASAGIDSVTDLRERRAAGTLPAGLRAADVFLLVDNWGALRAEVDDAESVLTDLAVRGLGVGVHVVLTANRWVEIRPALRDSIGTRVELRLNDPTESEVHRRMAQRLPGGTPGRGLIGPGVYFQAVLPRADGHDGMEHLREAQIETIAGLADGWDGPPAPPIRLLPPVITLDEIAPMADPARAAIPIGAGEDGPEPVGLDLTGDTSHCLVLGDAGAGKTAFLRTWMTGLSRRYTAREVRLVVLDFRRSLLGVVDDEYLGAYAGEEGAARVYLEEVAAKLRDRLPPAGIGQQELRDRSWWQGPEIYLVVDDADLLPTGARSPLLPLLEFLPQARDVGFHVVLARRVGGFTRAAMSDQMLVRLRELGATGLILSGDSREGPLIGDVRARPLPPGRALLVRRRQAPELVQVAFSAVGDALIGH